MLSFTNVRAPVAFAPCTKKAVRSVRANAQAEPEKVPGASGDVLNYAKSMPGISQPFPNIFDPANFLANTENKVAELRRWRESELTHGRVAMLASLGFIVQEVIEDTDFDRKSPFFPHVNGPAIGHFQQVESQGAVFWVPLLFAIGLAESYRVQVGWQNPTSKGFNKLYDDDTYTPGDLSFDPLGLYPTDPKEQYDLKTKELNNGRLAMIAIAGFVAQELVNHKELLETANELIGGKKNLSFDPLGLYPEDPKEQYDLKTRELNNGRLAMIAIAGFVAQELVNHKEIIPTLFEKIGGTKNA